MSILSSDNNDGMDGGASEEEVIVTSRMDQPCATTTTIISNEASSSCQVVNFRPSCGSQRLFRSAAPDILAGSSELNPSKGPLCDEPTRRSRSQAEQTILYDATLLLDLRMEGEVDFEQFLSLTGAAPGGSFEEIKSLEAMATSKSKRQLFRPAGVNGFNKDDLAAYVGRAWVSPKAWTDTDDEGRRDFIYQELDVRGLVGLYEIILETKPYILNILQAITIHLEQNPKGKVVFFCSIGKDRTGLVAMLCGSVLGLEDEAICKEYAESQAIYEISKKKFAAFFHNRIDSDVFAHATKETMMGTMEYLRSKYDSIRGYLDATGFNSSWQARLQKAAADTAT